MATKHSKGPWEIQELLDHEGGNPTYRITAESTLFLNVTECADGYVPGQNEANARLIAAAPDLLAEVERAHEGVSAQIDDMRCDAGNWDGGSSDSCDHCHAIRYRDRLAALISKATGGGPP